MKLFRRKRWCERSPLFLPYLLSLSSQIMILAAMLMYVYWRRAFVLRHWPRWSMDALRGWPEFFRFGLAGAAMVCLEVC